MTKLAEAWRPWRGVAAHLLWAYYHAVKRREGAPVQEQAKPVKPRGKTKPSGAVRGR
jgi:DNA-3-methyladenine glycosylase II